MYYMYICIMYLYHVPESTPYGGYMTKVIRNNICILYMIRVIVHCTYMYVCLYVIVTDHLSSHIIFISKIYIYV